MDVYDILETFHNIIIYMIIYMIYVTIYDIYIYIYIYIYIIFIYHDTFQKMWYYFFSTTPFVAHATSWYSVRKKNGRK